MDCISLLVERAGDANFLVGEFAVDILVVELVNRSAFLKNESPAALFYTIPNAVCGRFAEITRLEHFLVRAAKGMDVQGALRVRNYSGEDSLLVGTVLILGGGRNRGESKSEQD